jgi:hypothetical protein
MYVAGEEPEQQQHQKESDEQLSSNRIAPGPGRAIRSDEEYSSVLQA